MAQSSPAYPRPSRPLGVAIIAFLLGLYGLFTILAGILILVISNYGLSIGGAAIFGVTGTIAGLVLLVLGLIELGVAVGLWHLRMWALVLAVLVLLIEVFQPLLNIAQDRSIGTNGILDLVVLLLLLIYLIAVRRHFR